MPADVLKPEGPSRIFAAVSWYDLFSRGARDWLRHNEKVRDAVRQRVREYITGPDVLSRAQGGTVLVPVRLLGGLEEDLPAFSVVADVVGEQHLLPTMRGATLAQVDAIVLKQNLAFDLAIASRADRHRHVVVKVGADVIGHGAT